MNLYYKLALAKKQTPYLTYSFVGYFKIIRSTNQESVVEVLYSANQNTVLKLFKAKTLNIKTQLIWELPKVSPILVVF